MSVRIGLRDEVVQVVPIQSFGAKQNCSSKHLDRTSTGPGSKQTRRLNSLIDKPVLAILSMCFTFATDEGSSQPTYLRCLIRAFADWIMDKGFDEITSSKRVYGRVCEDA